MIFLFILLAGLAAPPPATPAPLVAPDSSLGAPSAALADSSRAGGWSAPQGTFSADSIADSLAGGLRASSGPLLDYLWVLRAAIRNPRGYARWSPARTPCRSSARTQSTG